MLSGLLEALGGDPDPRILVGFDTSDDAGVYVLDGERALVQTVDFITPVCDDPFEFGRVAAANSLSDVYAMGGTPLTALNVCCFPCKADPADLRAILLGGARAVREAGAHLLGGHSVADDDLKYGLSVTGLVHPDRVVTNAGARPGDALVLTKPVGTGVVIGGRRTRARHVPDRILSRVMDSMTSLNATAGRLMVEFGAHAATDVTGFGLAGHAAEVARASRAGVRLLADRVPFFEGAAELVERGVTSRVTAKNRVSVEDVLSVDGSLPEATQTLFFDPQTSGGLLVALPRDRSEAYVQALHAHGVKDAAVVGEVFEAASPRLENRR